MTSLVKLARQAGINPVDYAIATGQTEKIRWEELTYLEITEVGYTDQPELGKRAEEELKIRISSISSLDGDEVCWFLSSVKHRFPESELVNLLTEKLDPLVRKAIANAKQAKDLSRLHNFVQPGSETAKMLAEKKDQLVNNVKMAEFERRIAEKNFAITKDDQHWLFSLSGGDMEQKFFDAAAENFGNMSYGELKNSIHAVIYSTQERYLRRLFEVATTKQMLFELPEFLRIDSMQREYQKIYTLSLIQKVETLDQLRQVAGYFITGGEIQTAAAEKAITLVRKPADVASLERYDVPKKKRIEILRQLQESTPTPQG